MVANAVTSRPGISQTPPLESADHAAERHLVRRMIIGVAIMVPAGAALLALVVGLAVVSTGAPIAGPIAIGAGTGVLAGIFWGMWLGFVASASEFEELERR